MLITLFLDDQSTGRRRPRTGEASRVNGVGTGKCDVVAIVGEGCCQPASAKVEVGIPGGDGSTGELDIGVETAH